MSSFLFNHKRSSYLHPPPSHQRSRNIQGRWINLRVSCRLLPLEREMERKKPWTAGTVYSSNVFERSCGGTMHGGLLSHKLNEASAASRVTFEDSLPSIDFKHRWTQVDVGKWEKDGTRRWLPPPLSPHWLFSDPVKDCDRCCQPHCRCCWLRC